MTIGLVILMLFALFGGILVLLNLLMLIGLATVVLLVPLWSPLAAAILRSPRRYQ